VKDSDETISIGIFLDAETHVQRLQQFKPPPQRLAQSIKSSNFFLKFSLSASLAAFFASSFPGIPTWLGTQIVSFLAKATTSVFEESVAMSFLPGPGFFIVEWMAVIVADCSALKIVFCSRTFFFYFW
jgi:TctA family transporter